MSDRREQKSVYPLQARDYDLPSRIGSGYPAPFDQPCQKRSKTVLGDRVGLSQFGVNLLVLPPGSWSAQRHWHQKEDEFIYVLEGEVVLVTDEGESLLCGGAMAGFPAGQQNGHHLVNKSEQIAKVLEIGTRSQNETAVYPDIDMVARNRDGKYAFLHKNGEPYE